MQSITGAVDLDHFTNAKGVTAPRVSQVKWQNASHPDSSSAQVKKWAGKLTHTSSGLKTPIIARSKGMQQIDSSYNIKISH